MIKRYTRTKMGAIWKQRAKYESWLKVELAVLEAMAEEKLVPEQVVTKIKAKARFSIKRIEEIESEAKHDVIAFLTNIEENLGPESRFLHQGLTSSDILDTAMALRLKKAADILIDDVDELLAALKRRAFEHKDTVMIGRSHGIHAEPISFGLKLAVFYDEMRRNRERLIRACQTISYGKISGAVGTFANIPPSVEAKALSRLGLTPAPVSTQIIQRDRYAEYFTTLAVTAASLEKMAVEIRHLMRTEVMEVEERFGRKQKGSSAMPHKRNPVGSENIAGLARIVRGNALIALENVALWHERDISHSSAERVIGPDSAILLDFMLARMTGLIENLAVYPERMRANLEKTQGLFFSQQVLLALTQKGLIRDQAYRLVQKNALRAWDERSDFKTMLVEDKDILKHLSVEEITGIFDLGYHLKHVDTIFQRVFEHAD
ncbi:MAG: adenylosuccinate lyase [Deltaproteobacteria bacterium]|nr:adenylosuccinate lyase [Deltaproteobacteria bacterium]MBW2051610.1 adenylosuccinate lyase [Deltaproteobacteria bacterium]MBW2140744.1 adenylosuccinate lyase [Deltaproteobacteria bacterium]MBW2322695.1 adenylosuccinate lyase [Deltaproteobacteria bacterium]